MKIKVTHLLIALVFINFSSSIQAQQIERVEPPSWWAGMEDNQLQLMIYGENIAALNPAINHPSVTLVRTIRVENDNYLFLDLHTHRNFSGGSVEIEFSRDGQTLVTHDYEIKARAQDSAQRQGYGTGDAIYLITPDRFANGDPGNDSVQHLQEQENRSSSTGRHGGDIQGMIKHLDYIADMGFTAIWTTPLLENDQPDTSYHGYSTTDHYLIDSRFGSNQDYQRLVEQAHKRGIGVIKDIVLNHIGSEHWWMSDLPASDWLNFQDNFAPTSHYRTSVQDPYAAEIERKRYADGWFVESMPDLNQRNPLLANYLIQNTLWWIEYAGLSGIRVDTYSYSDKHFLTEWTHRVMQEYPNFNIVGEEWSSNPTVVAYWQRGQINRDGYVSHLPSLMDFPLYDTLRQGLTEGEDWGEGFIRVYEMLANDKLYADPNNLVIFAENHDTTRIFSHLGEDENLFNITMALLATMRGTPQFFYGSEVLATSPTERDDGAVRSDFPGGWPGDQVNGFTGRGLTAQQKRTQAYLKTLLNWRKDKAVIHHGQLLHFAPTNGVYTYFRYNDRETVMVAINKTDQPKVLNTERFRQGIGSHRNARDIVTGKRHRLDRELTLPPMRASIFELEK